MWQAAIFGALVLGAQTASAQKASQADLAKAKMLYDVGAQAFDGANYSAAIKAFQEAYRIAQRPGLVFSIAQAHRKQYYLTKEPENLREAVKFYREYASMVQQGGRRADVAEALAELEPLASRLDPAAASSSSSASLMGETRAAPQLMVSTQTKGAKVSLDGSEAVDAPLIRDVKPGPHKIKVTAEGPFSPARGTVLRLPIAHGEGRYQASPDVLARLEAEDRIALVYCDARGEPSDQSNPNGSVRNIAGVYGGPRKNVLGLMPHPERMSEACLGGTDGLSLFQAVVARCA